MCTRPDQIRKSTQLFILPVPQLLKFKHKRANLKTYFQLSYSFPAGNKRSREGEGNGEVSLSFIPDFTRKVKSRPENKRLPVEGRASGVRSCVHLPLAGMCGTPVSGVGGRAGVGDSGGRSRARKRRESAHECAEETGPQVFIFLLPEPLKFPPGFKPSRPKEMAVSDAGDHAGRAISEFLKANQSRPTRVWGRRPDGSPVTSRPLVSLIKMIWEAGDCAVSFGFPWRRLKTFLK